MDFYRLKRWIYLAVIVSAAVVGSWALTGSLASAQNAQGLAAVGAIDPNNGFPRWYMDKNGLQLGQCLDTSAIDPCAVLAELPDPTQPVVFNTNFPPEFFYWRAVAEIPNIGGVGGRGLLVLSVQGVFAGPTETAADGNGFQAVFARYRVRVRPNGLVPGATYIVTAPFGVGSFVADGAGTINFTDDQGCPLGAPLPCNFASVVPTTNAGPFLPWDPASAPLPPAGFIGNANIPHTITGSPFGTNFFRIEGPNVGGPGVNSVETNIFSIVIGKIYVRPATSTTLNSTPNPSVFGQPVTLTATVAPVVPDTIAPTGTVTFKDGATTLGTVTLVNGSASLVTAALAVGSHSLTASYNGDLEFATSTSAVRAHTVNLGQTTTTLTSTPNPSGSGQAVTLTSTVTAVAPAVGIPTGIVTFRDGAATLATVTLVNGSASFVTSTLSGGSHPLSATYSGSATFAASTSPTVTHVVNAPAPAATTTSLNSSPNPSTFGQSVSLSATVTPVPPASGTPTGTMTFQDGATTLATVALVGGSASFNTSTLAVGSHSLSAVYNGSASFAASTSAVRTQVVNPGNTTTSLTSSPNPSTVGQTVTLSSTVSPVAPASGIPTGSITFRDGATTLGVVALVNGSASLSSSTLTAGSHSLTAVYGGSTTFAASTSPTVTQIVNAPAAAATSTSLTSSPNPSTFGQTVTLSSTVTSGAGVPTGTVTFRDGASVLGTATLVNGSASISISTLAVGSHPLTALYGGSATFAASTSAVVTQVVNAPAAAATTTTLTSTPNPSTTGQAVTLSATVTSATGVPTGTVTFRDGATVLGTATLVNGSASISISTLAAGSHPLTALYGGSATFAASTSAVVTQVVNAPAAAATTTTLTSTPNPSTTGQAVTLRATVTSATGVPTGTVTFREGATVLGMADLVNGSASISISTLAVGTHSLTALYDGSATFPASTSAVVHAVNAPGAAATTTTLTSTPNPSTAGQVVALSARVTSVAGVPAGTVTFRDGANVLGTVTLVNGSASLSVSNRVAGTHPLTATYNGSATFAVSISATLNQTVTAAAPDTVTITRAVLTVATGELLVEGINTQIPGGGFAAGVTIWSGPANGASCTGVPVGSTRVGAGGTWQFRQVTPFRPTTVCVQSAGGGVASGAVTQQ